MQKYISQGAKIQYEFCLGNAFSPCIWFIYYTFDATLNSWSVCLSKSKTTNRSAKFYFQLPNKLNSSYLLVQLWSVSADFCTLKAQSGGER